METFDNEFEVTSVNRPVLMAGERILWNGKPKKSAFICEKSLTMLPFAVIWLFLDLNVISDIFQVDRMQLFFLAFFALHLMPVWIWLGSAISAPRRWKNTCYYVTNRRIIIQGGFLAVNEKSLFFKEIRSVQNKVSLFDKLFGTGSILFNAEMLSNNNKSTPSSFQYLENASEIYERVQRTVLDIQTEMEFPNAYRPGENPGYGTDYKW